MISSWKGEKPKAMKMYNRMFYDSVSATIQLTLLYGGGSKALDLFIASISICSRQMFE